MAKENKKQQKKRKRKKKVSKLFVSTTAFFSAVVVVIFCIYYIAFKTPYLNIISIDIEGNKTYDNNYITEKSEITIGEKIFNIDRGSVKDKLEKEVYIKNARVVYELPNRIYINITEREESYQVFYNNVYIILDDEGIVLNVYNQKSNLLTIESLTDVIYNIGESIQFSEIDDKKTIFETLEYCLTEYGSDTINKLTVGTKNSVILDTEYLTKIKLNLNNDIEYQIEFALKIINERLNNNLTVESDLIDFTKGDSPVYIEDFSNGG